MEHQTKDKEVTKDEGVECLVSPTSLLQVSSGGGSELGLYLQREFEEKRKSFLDITWPGTDRRFTLEELKSHSLPSTLALLDSVLATVPVDPEAADLGLHHFHYRYNNHGELRHATTGNKFHWVNQTHYDLLGDTIVTHLQKEMMDEFQMTEVLLPRDAPPGLPGHARNNIFHTGAALTNPNKLMLLIQGSGAVRPGQWARALCINDTLSNGSIFPYLRKAIAAGYDVIVFNPNQNSVPEEPFLRPKREEFFIPGKPKPKEYKKIKIPEHSNPWEHSLTIWDQFVRGAAAKELVIVAHSAGGTCTMELLNHRSNEILPRLKAIAFTDSVHSVSSKAAKEVQTFLKKNAINWVQSDKPLDTPERNQDSGCPCVSAGHEKHEWTSGFAIESVFKFLSSKTT